MPKIIDNLQEILLAEARRQVMEEGYENFNIRKVASACGVGVGTVYNYFPSRDMLIASFLAQDWTGYLERIQLQKQERALPEEVFASIYQALTEFHARYADLFQSASTRMPAPSRRYHVLMRDQIRTLIRSFCEDDFQAEFAAEALLTWTIEKRPFADIYRIIARLISPAPQ